MPVTPVPLPLRTLPPAAALADLLAVSLTGVIYYTPLYDPAGSGDIVDFRFEYLNPTAQRMMRMPEVPTLTHNQQWPHSKAHGTFAFHVDAYVSGEPREYNVNYQADGYDNYYRLAARRSGDGLWVSFTDTADQPRSPVEVALREAQAAEKAARAEVEAQRRRFYEVLMALPAQVATYHGPDHVFNFVNAAYRRYFPAQALPGRSLREVLPETEEQGVLAVMDRVYQTGEPHYLQELEVWLDFTGGRQPRQQLFLNLYFHPLRDAQGQVDGLLDFSYDVTEQVRARRQLQQLNQQLEARVQERTAQLRHQQELLLQIMRQMPAAVATLSGPDHHHTFFNDAYQALSGGRARLALPAAAVFSEQVLPGFTSLLDQVYATGEPALGAEMPVGLVDAATGEPEQRYVDFICQPLADAQDRTRGILAFLLDVTDKVRARQQAEVLQEQLLGAARQQADQRALLYQVFEETPAAICIQRGPEHRYEYANPAYQDFFPGRELLGRPVAEALPETVDSGVLALLDRVYQTGETYYGEELPLLMAQPDGHPPRQMYFTFTYQAVREHGQIVGISTFAYNVAEQVLARQQQQAQQRQLHDLFMQAPAPIAILDGPELVYQLVNPAYQLIFPGRALLGKPLLDALPELADSPIPAVLQQVLETGETYVAQEMRLMMARAEGEPLAELFCTFTYQARRNAAGAVDGVLVFVYDITAQVHARRAAEESAQQVRALVEGAPFPIGVYAGPDLRIQLANDAILTAWGKGPDVLGRRYADVLPELATQAVFEQLHQVRTTGQALHLRNQRLELVMAGVPQTFYYNYSFTPLRDTQGAVYGVLNTAADVTDLMLARQRIESYAAELRESEARFRTMADAAPNLVWAVHPDSSIRYINRAFLEFVGLRTEPEYLATGWGPYLHPDEADLTQQTLTRAIQQRQPYVLEHRMRRHDGQYRWLLAQGAPSYLPGGELYGYVGSAIDITDLKQANEQLRRTNTDLDNFIYTASHDLKAPIANIEGLLHALQHELPPASHVGQVPTILALMQAAIERFGRTIGHLTDISRLQQEHDQPSSLVPLARVVHEVQLDLAPLIAQTQAQVRGRVPEGVTLRFSEKNLRSVLYNLLSNALKYHHPDRAPVVAITYEPQAAHHVLEVQDNGLGLDLAQDEEKVFGMFQRLHPQVEGSGVGLYMVKKIIENAGGRIEVESALHQGSVFRVYFPR